MRFTYCMYGTGTLCTSAVEPKLGSRSGSDFHKVSAPSLTTAFILKSGFLMFFMKEYRLNSLA
jgi:hypothetical protein